MPPSANGFVNLGQEEDAADAEENAADEEQDDADEEATTVEEGDSEQVHSEDAGYDSMDYNHPEAYMLPEIMDMVQYMEATDEEEDDEDDEEEPEEPVLEAYGESVKVYHVATMVLPIEDSKCTICLEGFSRPNPSFRLDSCTHSFHRACILEWVNGTQPTRNTCPNCRTQISDYERPVRVVGSDVIGD